MDASPPLARLPNPSSRTKPDHRLATSPDGDDADLLAAVPDGLGGLESLYDRYGAMAYSIAQRITNDPSLAEDVVQEAFLGAWRNAGRYRADRGSVKTWLMAIVHHRAIDAVRRRKLTSPLPDVEVVPPSQFRVPDVWAAVSAILDTDDIQRALGVLTAVQRVAIELAFFGGLTQQEVADQTGAPLGTVKSRIRLGLLAMRRSMLAPESVTDPT